MRITQTLFYEHAKYYYWGFGQVWGKKKVIDTRHKYWKRIMKAKSKRKVAQVNQVPLPDGAQVIDANELVKQPTPTIAAEAARRLTVPWPFEVTAKAKTREDPNYKSIAGLHFCRRTNIMEGAKGAANFSNTIIESSEGLPDVVGQLEDQIPVPSDFLELLDRRLHWSRSDDGTLLKLPRVKDFPRLQFTGPRKVGIPTPKKESNTLATYHDVSTMLCSHLGAFVDRRKIYSPKCKLGFIRDDRTVLLDLQCDFVTTAAATGSSASLFPTPGHGGLPKFSESPQSTAEQELVNIHPCNWEICFDEDHYYKEDFGFKIPPSLGVHTIFLGTGYNHAKKLVDRFVKGRMLMFSYGYSIAQARLLHGNFHDYRSIDNYKMLDEPIMTQLVFINDSKSAFYFACFQLNTMSFDSDVKNQVWFDGPYDFMSDRETILRKMSALHLTGTSKATVQKEAASGAVSN